MKYENFFVVKGIVKEIEECTEHLNYLNVNNITVEIQNGYSCTRSINILNEKSIIIKAITVQFLNEMRQYYTLRIKELKIGLDKY